MDYYFVAANDRVLAIVAGDRTLKLSLKKHWLGKGLTKTQAALVFLEFVSGVEFDHEQLSWRKLRRTFDRHPEVEGLLTNNPPLERPIAHKRFFSLDSAPVEMWLRKVFGEYRRYLPPFVSCLKQDWETWSGERWVNADIPRSINGQATAAQNTHALICLTVQERADIKAKALQAEAVAKLEEMVQQGIQTTRGQSGSGDPWLEMVQQSQVSGVVQQVNPQYDSRG
jgi:hypothetical protein